MFVSLHLAKGTVTKANVNNFDFYGVQLIFLPVLTDERGFFFVCFCFSGGRKVLFLDLRVLALHRR